MSKKESAQPKIKMIFMITDAIFTLADRKGSSREAIWKYISSKNVYQESIRDKKLFLTQLKRKNRAPRSFPCILAGRVGSQK